MLHLLQFTNIYIQLLLNVLLTMIHLFLSILPDAKQDTLAGAIACFKLTKVQEHKSRGDSKDGYHSKTAPTDGKHRGSKI